MKILEELLDVEDESVVRELAKNTNFPMGSTTDTWFYVNRQGRDPIMWDIYWIYNHTKGFLYIYLGVHEFASATPVAGTIKKLTNVVNKDMLNSKDNELIDVANEINREMLQKESGDNKKDLQTLKRLYLLHIIAIE